MANLQTEWMDPATLAELLQVGDIAEFKRGIYSHMAIVTKVENKGTRHKITCTHMRRRGDYYDMLGGVFTGDSGGTIREDELSVIADTSQCRKNNSLDAKYPPKSIEEIQHKAALLRNGSAQYNLLFYNCESFVNFVRYDRNVSPQAEFFGLLTVGVIFFVIFLILIFHNRQQIRRFLVDLLRRLLR